MSDQHGNHLVAAHVVLRQPADRDQRRCRAAAPVTARQRPRSGRRRLIGSASGAAPARSLRRDPHERAVGEIRRRDEHGPLARLRPRR